MDKLLADEREALRDALIVRLASERPSQALLNDARLTINALRAELRALAAKKAGGMTERLVAL